VIHFTEEGMMRLLAALGVFFLTIGGTASAWAVERTFPAGSLILPVDSCWQPPQLLPSSAGCASAGSHAGVAGAYGLAYRLQRAGVPVYLADNPDPTAIAFVIHGQGQAPVLELPGQVALLPPSRVTAAGVLDGSVLDYREAPFLVDARDLASMAPELLARAPQVRLHRALVPFVAPVSRMLTGLPARLAVADEVAAGRVQTTLSLAGLGGDDGVSVVWETHPPATTAISACAADSPPASLLEGLCGLPALFAALYAVPTTTASVEGVHVAPLLANGTLYVASAGFPGRSGHLRAFSLNADGRSERWDAAAGVPVPGSVLLPSVAVEELSPAFGDFSVERLLFTNAGAAQQYRLLRFDSSAAAILADQLGSASVAEAAALINAVRGRAGSGIDLPQGTADRSDLLGAISSSTPALVGASLFSGSAGERARVLYVGSDDGLLHAILADSGRELWGYLPGGLLPALSRQGWTDATRLTNVQVNGSPAVSDQFVDFDGDGYREWRTVLVGTASAAGFAGVVFALDVTDPYRPQLLWEKSLAAIGLGSSRGVAMSVAGGDGLNSPGIFLTGAPLQRIGRNGTAEPYNGRFGVQACALDLVDGTLRWSFFADYQGAAANLNAPPAPPALVSVGTKVTGVVFGDLAGRLWVLDPSGGAPLGGGPVYQLPEGSRSPIGAGVAVRGRTLLFGSGGAEHADPTGGYAIYAVELLATGARLLWSYPLAPGEQMVGAPTIDRSGRAYLGVGSQALTGGRLLVLDAEGGEVGSVALAGPPAASLALAPGLVVAVSRRGEVERIGAGQASGAGENRKARLRILSWRFR
jgi:outer membrane protein assembly factor BamB